MKLRTLENKFYEHCRPELLKVGWAVEAFPGPTFLNPWRVTRGFDTALSYLLNNGHVETFCKIMDLYQEYPHQTMNIGLKEAWFCLNHHRFEKDPDLRDVLLERFSKLGIHPDQFKASHEQEKGRTLLFTAVRYSHYDLAQKLLTLGADSNLYLPLSLGDKEKWMTPLELSIHKMDKVMFELLMSHGGDFLTDAAFKKEQQKESLIELACINAPNLIPTFISFGLDPNWENHQGETPLLWLVKGKMSHRWNIHEDYYERAAVALIESGARFDIQDANGLSVVQLNEQLSQPILAIRTFHDRHQLNQTLDQGQSELNPISKPRI